ncbi:hypothetical protein [Yoonia sediminilitoris]|uniref:LTXXQ motif family protein n=1 Tax=Yoonia sediminilitoris TaxID=1286148 RepID=A0A2T6KDM9_9RHOB|nr:hypothetical protein [Yoonia sediminilitoris]PUB13152.1 hypothetical protein C8N45_10872 [Yoonia sediminilitoris]RCW94487.1 hypothetical protein DFP92_10873 [Yoonia sediminilitoris]
MNFKASTILKITCVALTVSTAAATFVATSATPAYAERGGNGNGKARGNGNGRGNSEARQSRREAREASRGNNGNNGRGHIARELKGLNAAHANPNALANAAPGSMPGKLNEYKEAHQNLVETVAIQDVAYAEYQRLIGLSPEEIAEAYPDGGYEGAVTSAADEYLAARDDAVAAQDLANDRLSTLTDGRELSDDAFSELKRLLNL